MNRYSSRGPGLLWFLATIVLPLTLTACNRPVIKGHVVDVRGEALPGVAVSIEGSDHAALSNTLGDYTIAYEPGTFELQLNKTGYTPGRISFTIDEHRAVEATTAEMWPIPRSLGVYLYDNYVYREATRVEPRDFFLAEGDRVQATERDPRLETSHERPLIVCFKTPRYDARLSRLVKADAKRGAGQSQFMEVWTNGGTIRPSLEPIDEAEGLLLHLKLENPLEPGVYAVHWGALEGFTATEKRIFLFRVVPKPTPLSGINMVFQLLSLA